MKNISSGLEKFIKNNNENWDDSKDISKNDNVILIEGRVFPNQIIPTSIISKIIEKEKDCIPLVVFSNQQMLSDYKLIYNSFGIRHFSLLNSNLFFKISLFFKVIKSFLYTIIVFSYYKFDFDWLVDNFKIENISFGDNIYDFYTRKDHTYRFLHKHIFKLFKIMLKTIYKYYSTDIIFKKYKVKYVCICTEFYINNGAFLSRIALSKNIKVILSRGFKQPKLFLSYKDLKFDYNKIFRKDIDKINFTNKNLKDIEQYLHNRFQGTTEKQNFSFDFAYKNKSIWSKDELKEYYGDKFDIEKPIVFIFLHAFSDATRAFGDLVFRDYYEWFIETMKIIKHIKSVNWIIKPHPSSSMYGEEGIVENMFENSFQDDMFLSPLNLNNLSVFKLSKTVITARGTIGIESACNGLRPILVGNSVYSDFDFVVRCNNKEEYVQQLENITEVQKLNDEEILSAKKVMYFNILGLDVNSNILVDDDNLTPDENLSNEEKIDEIYEQMANNLLMYRYENDNFYKNIMNKIIPQI